jgi:histidinol phosphatase-like enzyme
MAKRRIKSSYDKASNKGCSATEYFGWHIFEMYETVCEERIDEQTVMFTQVEACRHCDYMRLWQSQVVRWTHEAMLEDGLEIVYMEDDDDY